MDSKFANNSQNSPNVVMLQGPKQSAVYEFLNY